MFDKKLLNVRAVVFFVFFLIGIFGNVHSTKAVFECVFDTEKQAQVEGYCNNVKMGEAINKIKNLYSFCDVTPVEDQACDEFGCSGTGIFLPKNCKDDSFNATYKAIISHWDKDNLGTFDLQRALCGWNDINTSMQGDVADKNWASCQFKNDKCTLAEGSKEEICNSFDKTTCAYSSTAQQHGCKVQTVEKNGCYCNTSAAPEVEKYFASEKMKALNFQTNANYCTDIVFSNTEGITKCTFYVNNNPTNTKSRTFPFQTGNGCHCIENGQTVFVDLLLVKDACVGNPSASVGKKYPECGWYENNVKIASASADSNQFNGCFCKDKNEELDVNSEFIPPIEGYIMDKTVQGNSEKLCLDVVQFNATSTCAWVVNNELKAYKNGFGKKGCFCTTIADPNNLQYVQNISTGLEVCVDNAHQKEYPSCQWWEKDKMVSSTINYEAKAASAKTETTTPSTPGITVDELKNLASKNLNPMKFAVGKQGVLDLLGRVVKALMYAMGSILFALYIYAGILWMTSSGSSEKVGMAKKIVVWSTLGVIVQLSAYMIVNIVFKFTGSN